MKLLFYYNVYFCDKYIFALFDIAACNPPPPFLTFNRQARNPRFSFLIIIPQHLFLNFRLHIQYCFAPRHVFFRAT